MFSGCCSVVDVVGKISNMEALFTKQWISQFLIFLCTVLNIGIMYIATIFISNLKISPIKISPIKTNRKFCILVIPNFFTVLKIQKIHKIYFRL